MTYCFNIIFAAGLISETQTKMEKVSKRKKRRWQDTSEEALPNHRLPKVVLGEAQW